MDSELPDRAIANGHSTVVDDEHHQTTEESTVDKQNIDQVKRNKSFHYYILFLFI